MIKIDNISNNAYFNTKNILWNYTLKKLTKQQEGDIFFISSDYTDQAANQPTLHNL